MDPIDWTMPVSDDFGQYYENEEAGSYFSPLVWASPSCAPDVFSETVACIYPLLVEMLSPNIQYDLGFFPDHSYNKFFIVNCTSAHSLPFFTQMWIDFENHSMEECSRDVVDMETGPGPLSFSENCLSIHKNMLFLIDCIDVHFDYPEDWAPADGPMPVILLGRKG